MSSNQLESRLRVLTKSNDMPSDEEISVVQHCIAQEKLRLEKLDGKIEKAGAQPDELIKMRERHQKNITALNSIVSTIRRIPNELLGHIFTFGGAKHNHIDTRLKSPPLIFSQVCSRWRIVSHSTPMLWCSFSVTITPKTLKWSQDIQALMNEWFSRAYPAPLYISLTNPGLGGGDIILKHLLLPFTERVRNLTLSLRFSDLKALLKIRVAMPFIEVLDLSCPKGGSDHWNEPAISFEDSPRLRTVVLRSSGFLEENVVALPWSQLTELVLEYMHPVEDTLNLLSMASNLRKCSLRMWHTRRPLGVIQSRLNDIIHPNLNHLTIVVDSPNDFQSPAIASSFFPYLALPALRSASIGICGPLELALIVNLQSRSGFSLETLSLAVTDPNAASHFLLLLAGASALVRLCLFLGRDAHSCLGALRCVSAESGHLVVPCIEEIHLELPYVIDCQEVVDMVKMRWWSGNENVRFGVTRLKCLRLDTHSFVIVPAVVEQLRGFEREGLILRITEGALV